MNSLPLTISSISSYKKSFIKLFSCIAISLISTLSTAANLYISDELYVPVRKGQGNQFAILHKGLPSGTRVTLVQRDENWTQVTTSEGITGWIRNQFLNDRPPAKILLASANRKIERLTESLDKLKEEKNSLSKSYSESESSLKETNDKASKIEEELSNLKAISASAVESHQRLQTVAQKMQLLQTENDVLKSENESLRRSESTTFFLYGAFTVLLGVLLAIILPKLRSSKRHDGWIN